VTVRFPCVGHWADEPPPVADTIPLFRDVDRDLLAAVLSAAPILALPAGGVLLQPGHSNRDLYIVLAGEVAAFLQAEGQASSAIPIPIGQCVGEFSAIDGKPVSARVQAVSEARVLRIDESVLWSGLITLPGLARNLMVCLTERMRLTNRLTLAAQRESLELAQIRKELDLAHQLQAGMLPLERPLFPERRDLDVCASMEPASSVGGDLFDVFLVDENRLFLCIGDVSGHGIGAALLMARTIGLVRILANAVQSPAELLARLNDRLCEGNDTSVFVTMFCGFLDLEAGELIYSNGGHCAPLIISPSGGDDLPLPAGTLLGAFPGLSFRSMSRRLDPDELLFAYTDGITEAENGAGEPFSPQRCRDLLSRHHQQPLAVLLDRLRLEIAGFTGAASLEDDGTMLALRRRSPLAAS
jgi:sigma-B regulation protein RsbU (phosphoserine phosphatase)